jgi:hypothetical protein
MSGDGLVRGLWNAFEDPRAPDFSSGAPAIATARANVGVWVGGPTGPLPRSGRLQARGRRRGARTNEGRTRGRRPPRVRGAIPGEGLLARVTKGHYDDAAMALVHSTQVFEELGDRNSWGARDPQPRRAPGAVAPLRRGGGLPGAVPRDLREHGDAGPGQALRGLADSYRSQGRLGAWHLRRPQSGHLPGHTSRPGKPCTSITVESTASASLRVRSVEEPAGPAAGEFQVISDPAYGELAPHAGCKIAVAFQPAQTQPAPHAVIVHQKLPKPDTGETQRASVSRPPRGYRRPSREPQRGGEACSLARACHSLALA